MRGGQGTLLADPNLKSVEITVLGGGSSLVGGTLKTEILREEALELTLDGFLPFCAIDEKPAEEKRSLFRELGLPYVSDPAVTRHLAAFLERQRRRQAGRDSLQRRILHSRNLPAARRRCDGALVRTPPADPRESRSGSRGGGRRCVLFVRQSHRRWTAGSRRTAACLLCRRRRKRTRCAWCRAAPKKARRWNSTARICTWSPTSRYRSGCTARSRASTIKLGQTIDTRRRRSASARPAERRHPIRQIGRAAGSGEAARASDRSGNARSLGRFEDQRTSLAAAIRTAQDGRRAHRGKPAAVVSEEALAQAEALLDATFKAGTLAPEELPGKLEQTLALGRNSWPLSAIRRLSDRMLELAEGRRKSPRSNCAG